MSRDSDGFGKVLHHKVKHLLRLVLSTTVKPRRLYYFIQLPQHHCEELIPTNEMFYTNIAVILTDNPIELTPIKNAAIEVK